MIGGGAILGHPEEAVKQTNEFETPEFPKKEGGMLKTIVRLIKPAEPGADFERYLQKLQELDASGAPTREQAKRDFRSMRATDRYNFYTQN